MSTIRGNIKQLGMIIALVAMTILFQITTNGTMLLPGNITNLILQNSHILILAIGMMLVIITGRVDLSVGSLAGFSSALSGIFIISWGLPLWVAMPVVLLIGALAGAWNGYWIAYRNIPFFVVTLAGMLAFQGLTMAVLGGGTIATFPRAFTQIASGFLPNLAGGGFNVTAIALCGLGALVFVVFELRKRKTIQKFEGEVASMPFFLAKLILIAGAIMLFGYWFAEARGMPIIMILLAFLVILYSFIASKTVMGRHIYATGGNPKAAELNGIKTKKVVFWVYVNMGMLAALAGMVVAARFDAASPRADAGFELQAIAASFIGGASPLGGVGKIVGAVIGAMVMGVLNNGLRLLGHGADIQLAITGFVLLAAVAFDVYVKTKSKSA
ncbi:MAG: sugar ABC transporter permease [Oscillospiraceae bacterium]|nr:sugar ABC transporter permease [Oscillospiraceae bacterium]